jgi:site-specific recombinase XerC
MPKQLRRISKDLPAEQRAEMLREAAQWRSKHVWHPHQLRHSAGTEIRHKFGLEAAQVTLGHRRLEATQVYAQRNLELAVRVAREVG